MAAKIGEVAARAFFRTPTFPRQHMNALFYKSNHNHIEDIKSLIINWPERNRR